MTRLAQLIATEEGFFKSGSVPNRDHNPGDLRHSPHSVHLTTAPDGIGIIDSDTDGWIDLETQLNKYAARGLTVREMIYLYAPPSDGNNSEQYLKFVCSGLGYGPDNHGLWGGESVAEALTIMV